MYARLSSTDLIVEHSDLRFRAREIRREILDLDDRDYRYARKHEALCAELEQVNSQVRGLGQELQVRGIIKEDER
jgi:hypothetical protein